MHNKGGTAGGGAQWAYLSALYFNDTRRTRPAKSGNEISLAKNLQWPGADGIGITEGRCLPEYATQPTYGLFFYFIFY